MSGLGRSHGKCGLGDTEFTTKSTDNSEEVVAALNSVVKGSSLFELDFEFKKIRRPLLQVCEKDESKFWLIQLGSAFLLIAAVIYRLCTMKSAPQDNSDKLIDDKGLKGN